ncbi:MAG: rod shape-determining protein MreC, partial [Anaerolineaceae bacterium]|nr:rod shape-determining protein MreC [Anaerolineaceae bacterium]
AARVQLITDPGSLVNVKLESSKVTAQMVGSITGEISLELIPQDLEINPGEIVLTSGLGGAYPADILIGQIVDVNVTNTALFQTATIQAVVDIANLNAVLVITNFRPVETEPLIPTAIP